MPTSFKITSCTLILAAFFAVGNASKVPVLRSPQATAADTCGTVGVIKNFEHFIEDRFDAPYTTVTSCASACAGTPRCKSFNVRTDGKSPFCELHSGSQQQAGFVGGNGPPTLSMYQGFDIHCFDFVEVVETSSYETSEFTSTLSSRSSLDSRSSTVKSSDFSYASITSDASFSQSSPTTSSSSSSVESSSSVSESISTSEIGPIIPISSIATRTSSSTSSAFSSTNEDFGPTPTTLSSSPSDSSLATNSPEARPSDYKISLGPLRNNGWTYKNGSQMNTTQLGSIDSSTTYNSTISESNSTSTNNTTHAQTGYKICLGPLRNNEWTWKDNCKVKNPESSIEDTTSVTEYIIHTFYTTITTTLPSNTTITSSLPISSTLSPITKIMLPSPDMTFVPPEYILEKVYEIFEIHVETLDQCLPEFIDCKIGDAIEHVVEVGSAICPSLTAEEEVKHVIVCYQAEHETETEETELQSIAVPIELESIAVPGPSETETQDLKSIAVSLAHLTSASMSSEEASSATSPTSSLTATSTSSLIPISTEPSSPLSPVEGNHQLEARAIVVPYIPIILAGSLRGSKKSSDGVSERQMLCVWVVWGLAVAAEKLLWL